MKHTEHYQLNQWEANDKVQRTDFNADNAKIDAALAGKADSALTGEVAAVRTVAQSALALGQAAFAPGKLPWAVGWYDGTGKSGPGQSVTIQAGFPPSCILILQIYIRDQFMENFSMLTRDMDRFVLSPRMSGAVENPILLNWTDTGLVTSCALANGMNWNVSGYRYHYIAFR